MTGIRASPSSAGKIRFVHCQRFVAAELLERFGRADVGPPGLPTRASNRPRFSDNRWQWTKRDLPALEEEARMPSFLALSSRMELAFFVPGDNTVNSSSWDGWGAGIQSHHRRRAPRLRSQNEYASSQPNSQTSTESYGAGGFLAERHRYVAIEIGIGGYQPHPASDIFSHRYGDCKDRPRLLSSMLLEAGIRSDMS